MTKDIRFLQRFNNFLKAFAQLEDAVKLAQQRELSKLEKQGLIQSFEYTHELAWNVLKDFLLERGVSNIFGSKDATREAFQAGLIKNGEIWMDMIKSRNQTTHTYNEITVSEITAEILGNYFAEFVSFRDFFNKLKEKNSL